MTPSFSIAIRRHNMQIKVKGQSYQPSQYFVSWRKRELTETIMMADGSNFWLYLIKYILKRREDSETYLTHICRHRWSRKSSMKIGGIGLPLLKLRKATALAESPHSIYFHQALSAPVMSTNIFLKYFLSFYLPRFSFYTG